MKDKLWSGFLVLDVPHEGDTIGLMWRLLVVVVAGNKQLRVLKQEPEWGVVDVVYVVNVLLSHVNTYGSFWGS